MIKQFFSSIFCHEKTTALRHKNPESAKFCPWDTAVLNVTSACPWSRAFCLRRFFVATGSRASTTWQKCSRIEVWRLNDLSIIGLVYHDKSFKVADNLKYKTSFLLFFTPVGLYACLLGGLIPPELPSPQERPALPFEVEGHWSAIYFFKSTASTAAAAAAAEAAFCLGKRDSAEQQKRAAATWGLILLQPAS